MFVIPCSVRSALAFVLSSFRVFHLLYNYHSLYCSGFDSRHTRIAAWRRRVFEKQTVPTDKALFENKVNLFARQNNGRQPDNLSQGQKNLGKPRLPPSFAVTSSNYRTV
jgi:hypothetical protein